jgi:hypothetical protein
MRVMYAFGAVVRPPRGSLAVGRLGKARSGLRKQTSGRSVSFRVRAGVEMLVPL